MPNTSTKTPWMVVRGAKMSEMTRMTLLENSLELRFVTRMGQPPASAAAKKPAEGCRELVKMQQGIW